MTTKKFLVIMSLIYLIGMITILACTSSSTASEPPCRQQVFSHAINAATIYHQTHLQIVEVPVPAFIFQTLQAYQAQPTPAQVSADSINSGVGTNEMLMAILDQGGNGSNSLPIDEIRQKCSQCHNYSGTAKAGLRLFNAAGEYAPISNNKSLTRQMIAARVRSSGDDVMPPSARLDASKRLSETAAAFLER